VNQAHYYALVALRRLGFRESRVDDLMMRGAVGVAATEAATAAAAATTVVVTPLSIESSDTSTSTMTAGASASGINPVVRLVRVRRFTTDLNNYADSAYVSS
jgi:hypothetical protein